MNKNNPTWTVALRRLAKPRAYWRRLPREKHSVSTWGSWPTSVSSYQAYLAMAAVWLWATGKSQEVQGVLHFTSATLSKCVPRVGPRVALSRASQAVLRHSSDGESVGKCTSSEPSVAAIFNSRFGANSSGNHRALETPEFFSWNLYNTRVYSGNSPPSPAPTFCRS